jgi:hypothetical protein
MIFYVTIAAAVLALLVIFVISMCQLARRFIWPGEPLQASFVGSLIGASGTIFAATIAWAIADNNMALQQVLAELARETQRARAMEEVGRHLDGLLAIFPSNIPEGELVNRVSNANLGILPTAGVPTPSPLINDIVAARSEFSRLQTRGSVFVVTKRPQAELDTFNKDVLRAIDGLRALRNRVQDDVYERRKRIEMAQ